MMKFYIFEVIARQKTATSPKNKKIPMILVFFRTPNLRILIKTFIAWLFGKQLNCCPSVGKKIR
jgi:hypothetical protein